jgi:sugar phosphate isomerase/epimerase
MKLGFLTACMPERSLDDIAGWASAHDFGALEVACWPKTTDRDFQAAHIDVANFSGAQAEAVRELMDRQGLSISALGYYENNLHGDPEIRREVNEHLKHCIDAAATLGVGLVGTFIGRDLSRSISDNLREGERVLPGLVDYAGERNVRLVIENCPMEGWGPDGYPANLAYSPELWDWMFELGLYLNYDPSHLVWLGIDPVAALQPHVGKILHVQAKDTQTNPELRNRLSAYGRTVSRQNGWDMGWWRYRVPGLGEVDWRRVVDVLYEGGYDGVVSIEHEDPVWGGSPERIEAGLLVAQRTLQPLLVN